MYDPLTNHTQDILVKYSPILKNLVLKLHNLQSMIMTLIVKTLLYVRMVIFVITNGRKPILI